MRLSRLFLSLAAATLLTAGCSRQRDEATQALSTVETSLTALKDEAAKYAPAAYQGVESTLKTLQENLANQDYATVLAGTPKLQEAIATLNDAIASGKERFAAEWNSLSAEVPRMVEAIQARVDLLSGGKLPGDLTQQSYDAAQSRLESMKTMWTEATIAFAAGKSKEAAEMAKAVKAKGQEALMMLGMPRG